MIASRGHSFDQSSLVKWGWQSYSDRIAMRVQCKNT